MALAAVISLRVAGTLLAQPTAKPLWYLGASADRLEFRFRSAGDSVDVACSQIVVPSTWLVVSRVSGPTLIKNARWCREHYARIEGPDQTMQPSQLAGIHAYWTAAVEAASVEETAQIKRCAAKPLLEIEMERGEAIHSALQVAHPFTAEVALPMSLEAALLQLRRPAAVVLLERQDAPCLRFGRS